MDNIERKKKKLIFQFKDLFEESRVGITFLKLHNLSIEKLDVSAEAILREVNSDLVGIRKRIIQQFKFFEEKEEYYISSIIDVPLKFKELIIEEGEIGFRKREINIAKSISAIIKLRTSTMVVFSQSQRAVRMFNKYLKDLTVKGFNPVLTELKSSKMLDFLKSFEDVNHLKFKKNNKKGIKFVQFKGSGLLKNKLVTDILSNNQYNIAELGGTLSYSNSKKIKLYLNWKGRVIIRSDPNSLNEGILKELENLAKAIELMQSHLE